MALDSTKASAMSFIAFLVMHALAIFSVDNVKQNHRYNYLSKLNDSRQM